MSEKWETVGNVSKAKQNGSSKGSKVNGTKGLKKDAKVYTMEEVLPAGSMKNMYQQAFDPSPPSPKKQDKKETK